MILTKEVRDSTKIMLENNSNGNMQILPTGLLDDLFETCDALESRLAEVRKLTERKLTEAS